MKPTTFTTELMIAAAISLLVAPAQAGYIPDQPILDQSFDTGIVTIDAHVHTSWYTVTVYNDRDGSVIYTSHADLDAVCAVKLDLGAPAWLAGAVPMVVQQPSDYHYNGYAIWTGDNANWQFAGSCF